MLSRSVNSPPTGLRFVLVRFDANRANRLSLDTFMEKRIVESCEIQEEKM